MEGEITDSDRVAMVRSAVARLGREDLKAALARTSDASFVAPNAVTNALNALRKHRDPAGAVGRPQYRAALPYVAAVAADDCLAQTVEALGEHSDDPTRDQLLGALEEVRGAFPDVIIGVMLASVADADMPASGLCFEVAATDERFGLTDWAEGGGGPEGGGTAPGPRPERVTTPEQREARRLKKQKDAEERRRKLDTARRAGEQVRRARKQERSSAGQAAAGDRSDASGPTGGAAHLHRRASLTPLQEDEFDRDDPWAGGVVFAWVPFDSTDSDPPELDGKSRRCVVVAGSPTHLLVRAGYSEGGMKSRTGRRCLFATGSGPASTNPPGSTATRCGWSARRKGGRWAGWPPRTGTPSGNPDARPVPTSHRRSGGQGERQIEHLEEGRDLEDDVAGDPGVGEGEDLQAVGLVGATRAPEVGSDRRLAVGGGGDHAAV
jgi:hypothetical protein